MSPNNKQYRLCLQFNSLDPTQAEAIKLLKEMGHKKSVFIANAVLYYINNNPNALDPFKQCKDLNKVVIETWLKDILVNNNLLKDIPSNVNPQIEEKPSPRPKTETSSKKETKNTSKKPIPPYQPPETTSSLTINNGVPDVDDDTLDDLLDGLNMFG